MCTAKHDVCAFDKNNAQRCKGGGQLNAHQLAYHRRRGVAPSVGRSRDRFILKTRGSQNILNIDNALMNWLPHRNIDYFVYIFMFFIRKQTLVCTVVRSCGPAGSLLKLNGCILSGKGRATRERECGII